MIKNRRELEAATRQWMGRAKEDLRNQMIAFIEANGTNEHELSEALGISLDEIDRILNGGEISLSTFAKLLIATDNVIEIKPVEVMKQQFGGRMPQSRMQMPHMGGRMPFPPMGDGYPMPPMGEEIPQVHRFGGMPGMGQRVKKNQPNRLPNGRFAPKNQPQVQRVRLDEMDLDELGKNELIDIIRQNHWETEIDLNARRGELIEFLNYKIHTPEPEAMTNAQHEETENERIGRMLFEEVKRNPHLKEMVKKYL